MSEAITVVCSVVGAVTAVLGTAIAYLEYRRKVVGDSASIDAVFRTPAPQEGQAKDVPKPAPGRRQSLARPVFWMVGLLALGIALLLPLAGHEHEPFLRDMVGQDLHFQYDLILLAIFVGAFWNGVRAVRIALRSRYQEASELRELTDTQQGGGT